MRWRELEELGACFYREAKDLFERRFLCAALRQHRGVIS